MAQPGAGGPQAGEVGAGGIARMAQAAEAVRGLRADGAAILDQLIGAGAITAWRRYPQGEVYDPASHAQYFYHAHPGGPPGEHGHFHLFLRAEGMPPGASPLVLPELAVADVPVPPPQAAPARRGARDGVAHITAIAVDARAMPRRLFTTNRWVTGETWYRAEDMIRALDRFELDESLAPVAVNRWVGALVRLFRPQIAALLCERDAAVMAWRRRRRGHVLEDPRLEIASSRVVDLDAQLAFVAAADARPASPPPGLPRMAEGWGEDAVI